MFESGQVRSVLEGIIQRFASGEIPQAIALAVFPIPNIPCAKWSLLNRTIMVLTGTADARGIKQWNQVGRSVRKGVKSFKIMAPRFRKVADEESEKTRQVLLGFLLVPVFRVEDTQGDPLDYEQIKLPEFPLLERAREWGIPVKAIPGNARYYGYFSANRSEIAVASPEECVFFHELSHAAHHQVSPLKPGQDWKQEIVAELSAAVLCHLVGKQPVNLGQHYHYIEDYAQKAKRDVVRACTEVFGDIEKVLRLILKQNNNGGE
jgi:antirestriction protein ArdC